MTRQKMTGVFAIAVTFVLGLAVGQGGGVTAIADLFGDVNRDGNVNAGDAATILQYAAFTGAGGTDTLEGWQGITPQQQGAPSPYAEGWIEQREVYVDYDGDGTLEVADGYDYYLHLSGDYDSCYIGAYVLTPEDNEGKEFNLYRCGSEERDGEIYLTSGSSIPGLMCFVRPVMKDGTEGQAICVTWESKYYQ